MRFTSVMVLAPVFLATAAGCAGNGTPEHGASEIGGNAGAGGSHGGAANVGGSGGAHAAGGLGSGGGAGASSVSGGGGAGGSSAGGGGSGGTAGSSGGSIVVPSDPCTLDGGCPTGEWIDVTPPEITFGDLPCGNYGAKSVQTDPMHPAEMYAAFHCQGVWKSTNYGQTWDGPINTGDSGAKITDCAGSIALGPTDPDSPPLLYLSCIRGTGVGFWTSTDGGVNWTNYVVPLADEGGGQQFYPPVVDPYDNQHLLMAGHANNIFVQSTDGGKTWAAVNTDAGMAMQGGTGGPAFIDNGDASVTRKTWLWLASASGGTVGTWRTTDSGVSWTKVETNEHVNGGWQVYQPDTNGSIFMAGVYSTLGWGVLHSSDYGETWAHIGGQAQETVVLGTSKFLYALYGAGIVTDPTLEISAQPGTGEWTMPGTPPEMNQGPAEAAVTSDGVNNVIVLANYTGGLWRYLEP